MQILFLATVFDSFIIVHDDNPDKFRTFPILYYKFFSEDIHSKCFNRFILLVLKSQKHQKFLNCKTAGKDEQFVNCLISLTTAIKTDIV